MSEVDRPEPRPHPAALAVMVVLAVGLAALLATLPPAPTPAADAVAEALPTVELGNPVSGVLLVFRVLDTLLEKAALLAALGGVLLLVGERSHARRAVPVPMPAHSRATAAWLAALILPAVLVTAAYLVAIGADAPGGAFQAGTVGAAGLIVAVLAGVWPHPWPAAPDLRRAVYGTFLAFVVVGLLGALVDGAFMAIPALPLPLGLGGVKATVVVVGVALALGVAAILFALAMGAPPKDRR